jgi:hypothetical protein
MTGIKRLGCESDHSPLSSAKVKNSGAIPPLRNMPLWRLTNYMQITLPLPHYRVTAWKVVGISKIYVHVD